MLLPLVAVSGLECVDALCVAGFFVRTRTGSSVLLANGIRSVTVPSLNILPPDELLAILRDAGIPYSDFLDLLSEAPTDPDIRVSCWPTAANGR